ncbi:MAG: SRPBCC family protein [Gammaproteobacteria bacterium]|nr:SRPBCC family protein [Gammaproteobacteria bacterium]
MTKVRMSSHVNVSAGKLWELIGGFNALPDWHPAVEKSELEEGGQVRRLSVAGGGIIVERLVASDDNGHSYSYSIEDSPLPVANYTSELRVKDAGDGCEIEWSSNFEPSGVPESEAVKVIEGIYQAGMENLKKMFGG